MRVLGLDTSYISLLYVATVFLEGERVKLSLTVDKALRSTILQPGPLKKARIQVCKSSAKGTRRRRCQTECRRTNL